MKMIAIAFMTCFVVFPKLYDFLDSYWDNCSQRSVNNANVQA